MSLNVGNISARFGLDPSEFLERMRGVSGATKFFSDEMKREMRETSREGTESFRLIDEALGIHISKPLTRLLTQEFPGFAKGLQAMLGVGAVGALGMVGVEVFEKVGKAIEKAEKAQQELRTATANANLIFAEEISAYKEKEKAITAATEKVDRMIAAQLKQTKAAEDASGPWTQLYAAIGKAYTWATSLQSTMDISKINQQLGDFKQKYDMAAVADQTNKTHTATKLLADELARAKGIYDQLAAQAAGGHSLFAPGSRVSWDTVGAAREYYDQLKQNQSVQDTITSGVKAQEALERAKKTAESIAAFYREIGSASSKIAPDADPIHKLEGEITAARVKAVADFDEMRKASASALNLDHALSALGRLEALQDRVLASAKASADVVKAQAGLPTTIAPTGRAPVFGGTTAMPTLGAGGLAGAKYGAFANDQAAQLKLAAQAYQDALTPQDKYKLGQQELQLLVSKGLIDQNAYTAAMTQLDAQMVKAAESTHKLQEEQQKLLERSNDATAGLKAYAIQLQLAGAENGKFVYDTLNAATKSGEDDAVKSLMDVMSQTRGGHRQLIAELESMWAGYFKNIASMALKFELSKMLAPIGKAISPGGQPQSGTSTSSSSSVWGNIFGAAPKAGASGAGADGMTRAATMLQASATALQNAARTLSASGGGMGSDAGAGDDAGGGTPWMSLAPSLGTFSGYFANGGDATPGSRFISGESGAEEVDLDGRGGAHITPASGATAGGGDSHHYYDMRGAVVTDDLMTKAQAAASFRASEGRMMGAIPTLAREMSLRQR